MDISDQEYSVTCLASEQWSGKTDNIICSPIYCPSLDVDPTIIAECDSDNGSTNGVLVGSGCKFHCADEHATPQEGLLSEITCKMGPDGRTAQWDTTPEQFLVCKLLICSSIDEGGGKFQEISNFFQSKIKNIIKRFKDSPDPSHFIFKSITEKAGSDIKRL